MLYINSKKTCLQPKVTSFLSFTQEAVTEVVASAFIPHSKRTSLPRITFMFCGLVTINVGSGKNGWQNTLKNIYI